MVIDWLDGQLEQAMHACNDRRFAALSKIRLHCADVLVRQGALPVCWTRVNGVCTHQFAAAQGTQNAQLEQAVTATVAAHIAKFGRPNTHAHGAVSRAFAAAMLNAHFDPYG